MTTTKFCIVKNNFKKYFCSELFINSVLTILIFLIMLMIVLSPKTYTSGTISGLKLFIFSVLPGLFPFMLLTKLLTELGTINRFCNRLNGVSRKIFGTPGISLYAFLMSIISGYPIGAKIISDLYLKGQISENDAKKMSVFCTTSGPIFVIGTVGTIMFDSYIYGVIIYVSHILSSFLLGVIFNIFSKNKANFNNFEAKLQFSKNNNLVATCINETINSLFVVGAYITIFFLLSELLSSLKIIPAMVNLLSIILSKLKINTSLSKGIVYGILEVTRGVKELSIFGESASIIIASGLISFSGLSIIFQSMAFLKKAKIKTHSFIFSKLVHSIFSMIICFILTLFLL